LWIQKVIYRTQMKNLLIQKKEKEVLYDTLLLLLYLIECSLYYTYYFM